MSTKKDMTGLRFGRLVVLCEDGRQGKHLLWKCRCDCGNECVVRGSHLRNGAIKSCGCLSRDKARERAHDKLLPAITTHALTAKHPRLWKSVYAHFVHIRRGHRGYWRWSLDARYKDTPKGVADFCRDLLSIQPDECEKYEKDITLDLDKDNGGTVFCPECVIFRASSENRGKLYNNIKLADGSRLTELCRKVGMRITENRRPTKEYNAVRNYFRNHNGGGHPELLKKANELVALYSKCLKLLKLRDEVRQLAEQVKAL